MQNVFPSPVHYYAEPPIAPDVLGQSNCGIEFFNYQGETLNAQGYYYRDPREGNGEGTTWSTRSNSDSNYSESNIHTRDCKKSLNGNGLNGSKVKRQPAQAVPEQSQTTYKMKYKTELCRNYELQGNCKFALTCCYAHGLSELRDKIHLNSNYKSKICKHYHKEGGCPYGLR